MFVFVTFVDRCLVQLTISVVFEVLSMAARPIILSPCPPFIFKATIDDSLVRVVLAEHLGLFDVFLLL